MRFFRRSLVALGAAAMLPTIVFAAFSVFHSLRVERERVANATLANAHAIVSLADTQLQRHLAALDVLSSAIYFANLNWSEFYVRVQRLLRVTPQWETIVLIDLQQDRELFDLRRPFGPPAEIDAVHRDSIREVARTSAQWVSNIEGHEHPVVWIYVPVEQQGHVAYVIGAALRTQAFQDLLMSFADPQSTAGIVDRVGNFVARNADYEQRIGTPATRYVRDAIRSGSSGLYRGKTYEGMENYTAYEVSPLSGWSVHLAVALGSIDSPMRWSFVAAGIATLAGVLLAGFLVVFVLRDMAERRRAEEMLRQSQKMEAVGQLTGGIAHDFNNLLTAIIGNLDMIRTRSAGNDRLQRQADNALEAARRGAKLASQLLAFSRSQRLNVRPVDLQQLLTDMSGLLSQTLGPPIQVRMHIDEDARFTVSDANQLELALLNLAVNARDAMPSGGLLTIKARRTVKIPHELPKGNYIELCVVDTGVGMSEEVRARAIEPFYTTKPVGQGTGLGLSQVYGVVRESGGALTIESAVGRGTSVCLTLPATAPVPAGAKPTLPTVPAASRGDLELRVLVVDDDRLVRRFMTESLRTLKYQVTDVESGEQALAILDQQRFDLLLVDFAMPGMNGAEVARIAQSKQPGLKVLVVSGYADSAVVEAALGPTRQLRKPFDTAELDAAVAETLGTSGDAGGQGDT